MYIVVTGTSHGTCIRAYTHGLFCIHHVCTCMNMYVHVHVHVYLQQQCNVSEKEVDPPIPNSYISAACASLVYYQLSSGPKMCVDLQTQRRV